MVALSSLCSSVLEDIARLCLGKQRKFENTIMSLYSWESLTWSVSSISGFCSSGKILHGLGAIKSNRWPKERAKQDFRGHTWTISQSGGFMWMRCSRVSLYHTWSLGLLPLAPLWVHFVHSILPKTLSMNMSPSATVIKFNCWTCKHAGFDGNLGEVNPILPNWPCKIDSLLSSRWRLQRCCWISRSYPCCGCCAPALRTALLLTRYQVWMYKFCMFLLHLWLWLFVCQAVYLNRLSHR